MQANSRESIYLWTRHARMRRMTKPTTTARETGKTCDRLLDAAAELFATRGFKHTTVRDICDQAGANIAAINYHFGSKDKLHLLALEHARERAIQEDPLPELDLPAGMTLDAGPMPPEHRLRRHIHGMIHRALATGPASWYVGMILREMVDPTPALHHAIDGNIGPHQRKLEGIVAQLMGVDRDDLAVRDAATAIAGMCLHYHHCRAALMHLHPDRQLDKAEATRLGLFITRFALAGIAAAGG